MGSATTCLDHTQSKCCRILGSGRSLGTVADLSPRRRQRSAAHQFNRCWPVVSRRVASSQRRQYRPDPIRWPRNLAGGSRKHRGAILSLLSAWNWREARVASQYIPERVEQLAYLSNLAAERSEAGEPLSARGRHAVIHRAPTG